MNQETDKKAEISVAPMMDWTDRHCRYFHRLISPHARLYSEMVTSGALLRGDSERFLRFDEAEHPVALQLGGSDPADLAKCSKMGAEFGYDEINLNCGCPSDRVQSGRFGACLMREPDHVAHCVSAMIDAVDIPVSIKCRIGIDERDDFAFLEEFITKSANAGCKKFIVHARKAWLKGLSPKQNREIPPLDYDRVLKLKTQFPSLRILLNGGIQDIQSVQAHLESFVGVMIGREAYSNPYFLAEIENAAFNNHRILERDSIAEAMIPYAKRQAVRYGTPIKSITRHILGLYHHQKGAKAWKRALSTLPYEVGADHFVIAHALEAKNSAIKALSAKQI